MKRLLIRTSLLSLLILATAWGGWGSTTNLLLPKPQKMAVGQGEFAPRGLQLRAEVLKGDYAQYLRDAGIREGMHYGEVLEVRLVEHLEGIERGLDEAYRLSIDARGIHVLATTETGAYRALQTLQQLTRKHKPLPLVEIVDWPEWPVRGWMQDVGRTYIPLDVLKRQIALLARFKVNVFHWHLTENQAWRLESKAFPQLTSIAATERMPGMYYTLDEARELVAWCRQHHVMLIPEIDMPGHSAAFERAMGFGMQTERGKAALKAILREVAEAMDVPYIHIGTDEVKFTDPTFVPEMVAFVRSLGRKVISWNPGWDYKTGEIDMTQMWSYRGKPLAGTPAIDSRLHYINHYDLFADVIGLYHARIARQERASEGLAGAIIAIWNDRYIDSHEQITADNNLYISALALAERAWLGGGSGYFDGRTTVLWDRTSPIYTEFADFERRFLHYKETLLASEPIRYVQQTHAVWQIVAPFPNQGDLAKVFPPEAELVAEGRGAKIVPPTSPKSYSYEGATYRAQQVSGSGFYLRHVWGPGTVPGVLESPEPNHTAYAMAWVYSPTKQRVGLLLETQNYSRSESDLPPPAGAWDYRQSKVWLNGKAIAPPVWTGTHGVRSHEVPLGNENATWRKPIPVELRAGWNRIMLKLPVGERFSSPETRLVKWMFTASFVTLDGRSALPLRYHYIK